MHNELDVHYLDGVLAASRPDMHLASSSSVGSLTRFRETVRVFILKSYSVTSDIASAVRSLGVRSSAPISVNLVII